MPQVGLDYGLARFAQGFLDAGADIRWMLAHTSIDDESTQYNQGCRPVAVLKNYRHPLRSDGSSPWCGWGGPALAGNSVNSRLFQNLTPTGGYTLTKCIPRSGGSAPTTWTDAAANNLGTGNCCGPSMLHSVAAGTSRTGYSADNQGSGILRLTVPNVHGNQRASAYCVPFGPHPFSGNQCHARFIIKAHATSPTDLIVKGCRQWDKPSSFQGAAGDAALVTASTGLSFPVPNTTACDLSANAGTIVAFDSDCGASLGNASLLVANPTAANIALGPVTVQNILDMGARIFRSSSSLPLAGAHLGVLGVSSATMEDLMSWMGLTSGATGSPMFTTANAQAWLGHISGRGTGYAMPTHWNIHHGINLSTAEAGEVQAGTPTNTTIQSNIVALVAQIRAMEAATSSSASQICFTITEAHRNNYTMAQRLCINQGIYLGAISCQCAVLDRWTRTANTATTDFSTFLGPYSATAGYQTTTSLAAITADGVHPDPEGANWLAQMDWEAFVRALGYEPGVIWPAARAQRPRTLVGSLRIRSR